MLKVLAKKFLKNEVLREDDLIEVMGERPYAKPVSYDDFLGRFEKFRQQRTEKYGRRDGSAKDAFTTSSIAVAHCDTQQKQLYRTSGQPAPAEEEENIPELD